MTLLVYTQQQSPRLVYTFKHIFKRILQMEISFTSSVEEFVAHNGPKFSYGKVPLGGEFFIKSHPLIFEQGVNDVDINVTTWDNVPCFFKTSVDAVIPFDIFSASFYLLSRYEEYLPHVKDDFERFSATQSIAYKNNFLEKPIIDIWAFKLLELLQEKFPKLTTQKRQYQYIATFDIDNAFKYKNKGFFRNFGGFTKDLATFKFTEIWQRISVLTNFRRDPFDTYKQIFKLSKKHNFKTIFFFLLADYGKFDKNISIHNSKFKSLIKSVADYSAVGIHPSFFTKNDVQKLTKEKQRLENIVNFPIEKSRQHFLRFDIPETYQNLTDIDITEEYSMGYASHVGFRASTCTPFYFYNIAYEIQTPLKVFPFAVMDGTLKDYQNRSIKDSEQKIVQLSNEVKKVNGTFITLFHNDTLSNDGRWKGWLKMTHKITPKIAK